MSGRPPTDVARVVQDLETIRDGAIAGEAWAPALRAVELLGKHLGMWRGEAPAAGATLAEMIVAAAAGDG